MTKSTVNISFPPEAVELLLDWYRANARDLPWRENRDPYRVLVSEIMLQQTRAETVKPYFRRFLESLPTVADLAAADEETLLKLWEGLGYYSRVRNLQKAAQAIMRDHDGIIPADRNALLALPGVGSYTAGAVASIAFDLPVPAVDGNVLRVVSRLVGSEADILQSSVKGAVEQALEPYIPSPGAGDFSQSLIELGALICTPGGEAKCADCPLRLLCVAQREGRAAELPVRLVRTTRKVDEMTVLVLRTVDAEGAVRYAIRKRPARGLLGGLYEFPHISGLLGDADVRAQLESQGMRVRAICPLPDGRHLFTHREWLMRGYLIDVADMSHGMMWASAEDIRTIYPIPSAFAVYRTAVLALP